MGSSQGIAKISVLRLNGTIEGKPPHRYIHISNIVV